MGQPQYPGMEIDADLRQQRREWVIQRIAWVLLYGLLIAIILGLLGKGPISNSTVTSSDGSLQLKYEKFLRHRSSDTLQVKLQAKSDTVEMKLDIQYLRRLQITTVRPEPEQVVADDAFLTFVFNARPGAQVQVAIEFEPQQVGRLNGWISVDDKPRQPFDQFVYP